MIKQHLKPLLTRIQTLFNMTDQQTDIPLATDRHYVDICSPEQLQRNRGAAHLALWLESRGIVLRQLDGKTETPDQILFDYLKSQGAPADTDETAYHVEAWNYHVNNINEPSYHRDDEV